MKSRSVQPSAFTLVEILIVVVILGILAAVVTTLFTRTAEEAAVTTTYSEVQKLRRHVGVFQARNQGELPSVIPGDGTWGQLVSNDHFRSPPVNNYVGGANARVIVYGTGPDVAYHDSYGWIYDPATGDVWAAAFDASDNPFPRN